MIINRQWAMPNHKTFEIKPIREFILKYWIPDLFSIDPFANDKKYAKITNDLNPEYETTYHLDALDFLKMFDDQSIDFIFYDPVYSVRQVSECYKQFGIEVTNETTRSDWWTKHKKEISRIIKPNGLVLSFGWNSGGIGKTNGFEIVEILLVPHGGIHNDTICVCEKKI